MTGKDNGPVAVTGAGGFLGLRLCAALAGRGYAVRALLHREGGEAAQRLAALGVEVMAGDVREEPVCDRVTRGVNGVFHLAGITGRVGKPDSDYWDANVTTTKRLLKAASANSVRRFVYCSTADVLGNVPNPPADEDTPTARSDIYQITKTYAEGYALSNNGKRGLEVTVIRPTVIYGPEDRRRLKLFRAAARGRLWVIGQGDRMIHPVFVDDVAEGLILAYQSPAAPGRVYHIGGERYLPIEEWLRLIAGTAGVTPSVRRIPAGPALALAWASEVIFTLFGLEPPLFRRNMAFYLKNRGYSLERARRELGYEPKVSLEDGARRTLAWYREHGMLE